jgi:hypothetical protein
MDFAHALDDDLGAVGSISSWWFRDSGSDLATWIRSVEIDRIWQAISGKIVRNFEISDDGV